jgi:hypothetical protein
LQSLFDRNVANNLLIDLIYQATKFWGLEPRLEFIYRNHLCKPFREAPSAVTQEEMGQRGDQFTKRLCVTD